MSTIKLYDSLPYETEFTAKIISPNNIKILFFVITLPLFLFILLHYIISLEYFFSISYLFILHCL